MEHVLRRQIRIGAPRQQHMRSLDEELLLDATSSKSYGFGSLRVVFENDGARAAIACVRQVWQQHAAIAPLNFDQVH